MRSRYHPDGSVDYEADRMLEILRNAEHELDRLRREQEASLEHAPAVASKPTITSSALAKEALAMLSEPPAGLKPLALAEYMNSPCLSKPNET